MYMTWPREPGSPDYKRLAAMKDFSHSYRMINGHSQNVAERIGADMIPVGSYWLEVMQQMRGVKLYSDGSHPSLAGSYLNALVFYRYLIGQPHVNDTIRVDGLDDGTMQALQVVVAGKKN